MSTTTTPDRTEQPAPTPAQLLGAIRLNVYRLTVHTNPRRDDPRTPGSSLVIATPLLSDLRAAIRPSQGRTDSGRGGGGAALPYDHVASVLLARIEGEIQGMYRSGLDREPIGTVELLLLEWFKEFERAYDAGDVVPAQLTTMLQRIRGWRWQIEDHFTPPRQREFAFCPQCGYTHHLVLVDDQLIRQRCVVITWWPGNERRPPIGECRREECTGRWVGWDAFKDLNAAVEANIAEYGDLEPEIIAPPPEPTALAAADGPQNRSK